MLAGEPLDDAVLDDVWLDGAVVADDWSELRVHEDDSVPAVPEEVRFDAGTQLTSRFPVEDALVSNEAAAIRRSFKQKD